MEKKRQQRSGMRPEVESVERKGGERMQQLETCSIVKNIPVPFHDQWELIDLLNSDITLLLTC